jgi:hypothetical protein
MRTFHTSQSAADDGEQLRIVTAFQTTVRGAHPSVLLKLGAQRLADLTAAIQKEQDALVEQARQVKAAINSSLSVAELAALGPAKLAQLGGTGTRRSADQHAGYSLNAFLGDRRSQAAPALAQTFMAHRLHHEAASETKQ